MEKHTLMLLKVCDVRFGVIDLLTIYHKASAMTSSQTHSIEVL